MTIDSTPAVSGAAGAEAVCPDEFHVQLDDGTWKAFSLDVSAMLGADAGRVLDALDRGGVTIQVHFTSMT